MPWMRSPSARADVCGLGLGDLQSLRDLSDLELPELWLDCHNVVLFIELCGKA
jgi:hypothetical protein